MNNKPLEGKKIAILLESDFIPHELETYERKFSELGAKVEFVSRLWSQNSQTFQGHIDPLKDDKKLYYRTVYTDFKDVNVDDYVAILMAANFCSMRLRYFQPPDGLSIQPEQAKTAPAVQFFAKAMEKKCIVKGALCHGLWILTPMPELLKGRKVICHEVVLADIVNAGAVYQSLSNLDNYEQKDVKVDYQTKVRYISKKHKSSTTDDEVIVEVDDETKKEKVVVVVNDDLVTGYSAGEVELYVDKIAECIIAQMHKKKYNLKPLL